MARIRIRRRGRGRPRTRPSRVLGDKAYSSRAIRSHLRATPDQDHHPRARQSTNQPATSRPQRRTATTVRPRNLQAAQHRRARHQQTQGLPGRGHPIRQTRLHVPRNHRYRLDQNLAPRPRSVIHGTRPSTATTDCDLVGGSGWCGLALGWFFASVTSAGCGRWCAGWARRCG